MITPIVIEGHPVLQWLVLHGKVSMLKQFVSVSMTLQNLSSEPFQLAPGTATLSLPAGLSLAPTGTPQAATQEVEGIPGNSSQTVTWVIRGDDPGYYYISAQYHGKLLPFEAPVEAQASLATPLHIWGAEALSLSVKADSGKLQLGVPYHVVIGVKNKSTIPLYNINVGLEEGFHPNFIYQPDERFNDSIGELPAGSTFYTHTYVMLPALESVSVFNPAMSSAVFDGEVVHPGQGIEEVAPPPLYTLESVLDTPHMVHLHWQSMPGTEGYEVFSTPNLETPFAATPDAAATSPTGTPSTAPLPANATDAYLLSTGSVRDYVVSTLIDGVPTDEAPAVEAVGPTKTLTVKKVSPKKGPASGGSAVTITGSGFVGVKSVRFGGVQASAVKVESESSLTAVAPPHTTGTVDVVVTTLGGTSPVSTKDQYTYGLPTITSISPSGGPRAGGNSVSIWGSGFAVGAGTTSFLFGKAAATSVYCSSSGYCTATVPSSSKRGNVTVAASVASAKSKKGPGEQYTYE